MGCSFVMLLAAALIIGMPLRDLAVWAGIFLAIAFLIYQFMKRRQP